MSAEAQEETPTGLWYQLRVSVNGQIHLSKPGWVSQDEMEKLQDLIASMVKIGRNDGGQINFEIEGGGGWTFIPARSIDYMTILKVDPPA